jgi:glycogen operon protein
VVAVSLGETPVSEFAVRFAGSADLYANDGRRPAASINFITAHDGFTLADLVSYNGKHNDANGEDNQDGTDDNRSWNCGAEGPTDDTEVTRLRARQQRNLLTTLLLSQGVPMLLGGDEFGRSQNGNNNAWCQDSDLSWYHWDEVDDELGEFVRQLIALRLSEPVFRRRDFLAGEEATGRSGLPDVVWIGCDGDEMQNDSWGRDDAHALGVFLNGDEIPTHDRDGNPIKGRSFLLLFNAHHEPLQFTIPQDLGEGWTPMLASELGAELPETMAPGDQLSLCDRSLLILRRD